MTDSTGYYTAAVWYGYDSNEPITVKENCSAVIWKQVMQYIHKDLPDRKTSEAEK